ncbi:MULTISPECIES: sugar phosphate isomerase/epimerase [Pseudarthrobacter]|uniref:sugar phosphate isomerase/epimerase family protein n=1 Tax=Pseudarthrobacter TaxID=1742993 RepID=UPI0012FB4B41|nr:MULTISPECIES: sugar phosphate isomerase/epimerase family protein [Pseudarthrobacter]MUU73163.1 TIM barrel protein [Pseudarthrobacter sp. GA104]WPU07872.1 sugar phosphate isomerase/epimerase family protein [Pseudarthrobacter oxydans]HET7780900.1 sugar phosphate isomerase/epimerase family protein [Arthrobacter sp.]
MTSTSGTADFARLSINSATTKKWTLAQVVEGCVNAGIPAIGPWRDRVAEAGLDKAARLIKDAGLRVSSLCRGGFLTAPDAAGQAAALADNRAAILEAVALDTRELFLVVGGLAPGEKDVVAARRRVADRLADLVPFARENGVRLVLEPLHPMYAADRALISTLGQALDLAAPFDASAVGVAVDTFHVWWDPELKPQIERAGREGRLASYQVCDFNMPIAADPLLSRGYMGDGVVDFATIGAWVRDAGYTGDIEVEIFNQDIWGTDGNTVLATVKERYAELVLPYA